MKEVEKQAKRVCPLFSISPTAVDKHSYNCGSCLYYNTDMDRPAWSNACLKHAELRAWKPDIAEYNGEYSI